MLQKKTKAAKAKGLLTSFFSIFLTWQMHKTMSPNFQCNVLIQQRLEIREIPFYISLEKNKEYENLPEMSHHNFRA